MKKRQMWVLMGCSGSGQTMAQDVSCDAKVSKRSRGVNERLRIDFIMNQNGDNFTPPDFSGFRIVGGPNQ